MDAAVQLALMVKAKMVFETAGAFLSFPVLSPLSFHPAQLNFASALSDPSVGGALEDFSRAVNSCPSYPLAGAGGDDYLWDRYDAWLNAMQVANDQLDPAAQSAYDTARSSLVVHDAHGFVTDSPMVVAYKQCRDAVINQEQAYKAAQVSAANSGNPDALADWTNNQAPALQRAIDAANADWIAIGHKAEVEAAQNIIIQSEARLPHTVWVNWRSLYSPLMDSVTNPVSKAEYVPSGFAPADLADQAWTTLTMTGPEIATLTTNAPPALRTLFGDLAPSSIASISFEFRSAAVVRPWFTAAMFSARCWKFSDGSQLSDGATPPTGAWPAYITGVVFIRNVQVTEARASPRPISAGQLVQVERLHIPPSVLTQKPVSAVPAPITMRPGLFAAARPMMMAPAQRLTLVKPAPPVDSVRSPLLRLGSAVYRLPTPTPTPAPAAPDDSIAVLAYICKAVPKCPNPDPTLSWT